MSLWKCCHQAVVTRLLSFQFPTEVFKLAWQLAWHDAGSGVSPVLLPMVLGGEVSMWSDDSVYPAECSGKRTPQFGIKSWLCANSLQRLIANRGCFQLSRTESVLYNRSFDEVFAQSIGGLLWPRGFVAAGAFYRFDPAVNVSSTGFTAKMGAMSAALKQHGALLCPAGCGCGYCTGCDRKPYSDKCNMHGANCSSLI